MDSHPIGGSLEFGGIRSHVVATQECAACGRVCHRLDVRDAQPIPVPPAQPHLGFGSDPGDGQHGGRRIDARLEHLQEQPAHARLYGAGS